MTFRQFVIVSTKSGINAALVAVAPIVHDPAAYNLHTGSGWEHVFVVMGGAVLARELTVWLPRLMLWTQTPTNGVQINGGDKK